MDTLTTTTLCPRTLSKTDIVQLFGLYSAYYGGTSLELFCRDLQEKDHILLLLHQETGVVCGFSTLKIIESKHNGRSIRALFSGDTIIHHKYWGSQTLPLAWCALAGRIKAQQPKLPLYWLLIVKGDRTYRYLSVFSKEHYPSRKKATPPEVQALMDALAYARFGAHYHPQTGLVHYPQSQGHLKAEWANPTATQHPEARYFNERNPNHAQGDELVCLTQLEADNLRSFALRGFLAGLQTGPLP